MIHRFEIDLAGRTFSIETGRMAKQADGAVLCRYGDTMVLVAVVGAKDAKPGVDFLPLTVDYREMTYAAGKIPGGFFKREGRPTEKEILTARLIDRPIRPLFPEGYNFEIQVHCTVLSADKDNDPDTVALIGTSAALVLSGIPFQGPVAGIRVGRVNGQLVLNPKLSKLGESDLNLAVAGGRNGITMVEGGGKEVPESVVLDALFFAQDALKPLLDMQDQLRAAAGKAVREFVPPARDEALVARVKAVATPGYMEAVRIPGKHERSERFSAVKKAVLEALAAQFPEREKEIKAELDELKYQVVRKFMRDEKTRLDGRGLTDIRPISCEVALLPRTHGSALFTRGETQALAISTLGSSRDEQRVEALAGESVKRFMLHYKFPPFSVGEVRPIRGPSRREIGHGALAERALVAVLPSEDEFPYTIRIVSEVLESNGSSSMATVCGGCLSMMDAGVPVSAPVAGIAMGLVKEEGEFLILSDILGDEDHLGDMDFKVAGTGRGVTAVQMDIKCDGVDKAIMGKALEQAREGRIHILKKMTGELSAPREAISPYAPRITSITIPPERIKDVIGPGGRNIRKIQDETGAVLEIENDGTVKIFAADTATAELAIQKIKAHTQEAEIGKIYQGTVRRIMDFGAFVEILPGIDGLVHISQLAPHRVQTVTEICKEGDKMLVKVLDIDRQGKIRLSRKEAMGESEEGGNG
ncbi:MAG: polyribonucleotide nucleotidyltransferase [bacterium]